MKFHRAVYGILGIIIIILVIIFIMGILFHIATVQGDCIINF